MVGAAGTSLIRLAGNGCRRNEWMPAQGLAGGNHLLDVSAGAKRGHRIFAFASAFEDVSSVVLFAADVARLAGDSDLILHSVVVRFELFVADGPILDGRAFRNTRRAIAAS